MTSTHSSSKCNKKTINKEQFQVLAGTRDFYPDQFRIRQWLFNKWTETSERFGFNGYDGPILEKTNLYTRKGGDDIINEMYCVTHQTNPNNPSEIKDDICVRPEMTPTMVRMAKEIINVSTLPLRWYSIAQCWRYETTTKGRKREHYQWNNDIMSGEKIPSIIEILSMIIYFFNSIGLTSNDIVINISNRMIIQEILSDMNIDADKHEKAFNIIDKIKKVTSDEISQMLINEIGLNSQDVSLILKLVAVKNVNELSTIIKSDNAINELRTVLDALTLIGYQDWIQFDASIVRGLSYYTGIVFEAVSRNTDLKRSICGGGQYDNLFITYGYNKPVNTIGFGFGDVVILEILRELNKLPVLICNIDYCIVCYNYELYITSLKYATILRNKGFVVNQYMKTTKKIKNGFDYANKIGAKYVILFCPEEFANDMIRIKNLTLNLGIVNKSNGDLVKIDEFFKD